MKYWKLIIALLFSSGLFAANENPDAALQQMRADALARIDVIACLDKGGVIKAVCMNAIPACIYKYPDAGKQCRSGSECEGDCLVVGDFVGEGSEVIGQCKVDNDPCGCYQRIFDGVAEYAMCTD
ncbi:hypothetical protein [Pseudoalteromonas sp. T1lg76]|uniref:hypothetical protein n=1 Tax=Pseudoalteromonas sp. T1lg76 TaxID=2077103 RepID=UPI000CF642CB|nr:hypothetical protein [Pseudoalteromonas sp. T1lg76]